MEQFFKKYLISLILFSYTAFPLTKAVASHIGHLNSKTLEISVSTDCDVLFTIFFCYITSPEREHLGEDQSSKLYCPRDLAKYSSVSDIFQSLDVDQPPEDQLLNKLIGTHNTEYDVNFKKISHVDKKENQELATSETFNLTKQTTNLIFLKTIFFLSALPIYAKLAQQHAEVKDAGHLEKPGLYSVKLAYYFFIPALRDSLCWEKAAYKGDIKYLGNWFLLGAGAKTSLEIYLAELIGQMLEYTSYADSHRGWVSANHPTNDGNSVYSIKLFITKGQKYCDLNIKAQVETKPLPCLK